MSRTVLALAVMFSVCGGPGAAVSSPPFGQQPSSGKPDLSGRWVLNQAASDDAREKLQGVVGGRAGGGGGRPGRTRRRRWWSYRRRWWSCRPVWWTLRRRAGW